mgnify:CR=1 FL=1
MKEIIVDISDDVQAGNNSIELHVTNTLINILEGVNKKSGLFVRPRIVHRHVYQLAVKNAKIKEHAK